MISFANKFNFGGRSANFQWEEWKYVESHEFLFCPITQKYFNNKGMNQEHIRIKPNRHQPYPLYIERCVKIHIPPWSPATDDFFSHDYTSWIQISRNTSALSAPTVWSPLLSRPEHDAGNYKLQYESMIGVIKTPCLPRLRRRLFWFYQRWRTRIRGSTLRASKQKDLRRSLWSLCWYKIKA